MPQTYGSDITKKANLDQFNLILMAAQRAKELQQGAASRLPELKNSPTVTALAEIEQGLYTREHYERGPDHQFDQQSEDL